MTHTFNRDRREPLNVQMVDCGFPLVTVGGKSLYELREDHFDLAVDLLHSKQYRYISAYDFALGGGEPYSNWK